MKAPISDRHGVVTKTFLLLDGCMSCHRFDWICESYHDPIKRMRTMLIHMNWQQQFTGVPPISIRLQVILESGMNISS